MITISIHPQTPAHMAILGKALLAMLEADCAAPADSAPAVADDTPSVDEMFPLPAKKRITRAAAAAPAAPVAQAAIVVNDVVVAVTPVVAEAPSVTEEEFDAAAPPAEPEPVVPAVVVTLEAVRAKLAALSQAGHGAAVKEIINGTGNTKLTDIPADQYATVLAQAEALAA